MNSCSDNSKNISKRGKISDEQKEVLLHYLEKNPQLRLGKFTANFTYKTSQCMWKDIANTLNAIGPIEKDWKQWRKTWQDIKGKLKGKLRNAKQHRNTTGGGPNLKLSLDDMEEKTLNLIGHVPVHGQPHTINSSVNFQFLEDPVSEVQIPYDHTYVEIPVSENDVPASTSSQIIDQNIDTVTTPSIVKSTNNMKIRRLENSIKASQRLADQLDMKLELKKEYCEKKLILYEQSVHEKRRIANALEQLIQRLKSSN